jgi:hypothetical protein
MPLINVVIALVVVGVGLWLINNYIPMASSIKTILNIVVVVAVVIWVLQAFGMWGRVTSYKFPSWAAKIRSVAQGGFAGTVMLHKDLGAIGALLGRERREQLRNAAVHAVSEWSPVAACEASRFPRFLASAAA